MRSTAGRATTSAAALAVNYGLSGAITTDVPALRAADAIH
jgi:hypothetical protein